MHKKKHGITRSKNAKRNESDIFYVMEKNMRGISVFIIDQYCVDKFAILRNKQTGNAFFGLKWVDS